MPNIFGKSNLFWTPESVEELQEYVEQFNSGEKALAYAIMGMTWNLAAKLYEEKHPETEAELVDNEKVIDNYKDGLRNTGEPDGRD